MLFSSMTFIFAFLPLTVAVYYLMPRGAGIGVFLKNFVLLLASLVFYAWGEPVYIVLIILSIFLNYFCGLDIEKRKDDPGQAKRSLIFAVTANLLILGFFKYYGFLLESINAVLPVQIPYRVLSLPIGISFYTFQALSYLIDIYRGQVKPQKNVFYFALYISMFPQLIAGPIVRYVDIESQLRRRTMSMAKFGQGAMLFICGLAKKVILANSAGAVYEQIAALPVGSFSVFTAWTGGLAVAFQIYFDFGGYSDMALGLGKMFGFDFQRNFRYPYISRSITEFWRRWHISLGTWFREYVYIPLGGNRCTVSRNIMNLLIVWILTGLWHGAAWNFVVWGLYYGILLVLEKHIWGGALEKMPSLIRRVYTLAVVLIGWILFFSPSLGTAIKYIGVMFGAGATSFADTQAVYFLAGHWLLFLLCILGSSAKGQTLIRMIPRFFKGKREKAAVYCLLYIGMFLLSVAFLVTGTFNPFLYFRF